MTALDMGLEMNVASFGANTAVVAQAGEDMHSLESMSAPGAERMMYCSL